jgi:hypothetical protein
MISIGATPGGAVPAAPQAGGYGQMPHAGMPQMPQANLPPMPHASPPPMPVMAAPAMPHVAAPQFSAPQPPPPVQAPSSNILLFAILGLAMFLVGGVIVYLLMRH